MNVSKHLTNVVLFPLCDARSVLLDALCDTSGKPTTRHDALILAWRCELPKRMDVGQAADALLTVAMSGPRERLTRAQLLIVDELMVLSGRKGSSTELMRAVKPNSRVVSGKQVPRDRRTLRSQAKVSKESKEWWKLVGRDTTEL